MSDPTRPFLVVYVLWHPEYAAGAGIAEALREHFRRKLFENVAGGTGLSVIFRSAAIPGNDAPPPIDLDDAETTAAIILADSHLVEDPGWVLYVHNLVEQTEVRGLGTRVFPVSIEARALDISIAEQVLRWDLWPGDDYQRRSRLISELAYELCRMLRHHLEHLKRPTEEEAALTQYLKKVQIFLSHSKHDDDGDRIARAIRERLQAGHGLASFFDVHDIPSGLRFNKVLLLQVKLSAVVAVHTDSYSSREWCRQEIIEAKRWNVPLVVANCLTDLDERGFPYMGNVPIVRMNPRTADRIDVIIARLLDEVLKDFLWRCRVELARALAEHSIVFMPRPPELISLTNVLKQSGRSASLIIYPDPPLSESEAQLFAEVAPRVRLQTMNRWLASEGR
jgi:TIR domain